MIDQELDLVGKAFADVRLDGDARDVISRGRTLRRRRKAVPALATAGIVAAALSLAAVTQSSPAPASSHALGYNGAVVNVDEAGFSIHTDVKTGAVTVTFRQIFNESQVRALLAKAGVPAAFFNATQPISAPITPQGPCTWTGAQKLDPGSAISAPLPQRGSDTAITVYPSKMPAGSVLGLLYDTIGSGNAAGHSVGWTLLSGQPTGCVAS
jgi:hypothetical protein